MKRAAALLLSALLLLSAIGCEARERRRDFFSMDTYMELRVYGDEKALDEAERLVYDLEKKLSVTDGLSEISRLNRDGSAKVSEDTAELIASALELCYASGGALDISVYPIVRAWGFTTGEYRVPSEGEIAELLERVDYKKITVSGETVSLGGGMLIDLGSVAKGYAGDRLMELFRERGIASALVNLGGNVQCLGRKPDGSLWRVAVQDPRGAGYIGILETEDRAVITSGGYERYFEADGEVYWHIIDPETGCPARSGLVSVTVVGESGQICDGLSTALFVMGEERATELWRSRDDFEAIFVSENGDIAITEGLYASFTPSDGYEVREVISRD